MKYSDFFSKTFLFKNIDADDVSGLLKDIKVEEQSFCKGDAIYKPDVFVKKVGFICVGECTVSRQSNNATIPLNTVKATESFGITACFSNRAEFPTVVNAKTDCTIVFINADDLRILMKNNPVIALNIIEFLTKKINFLNDKIEIFSGGSVEEKLASYILGLSKKYGSCEFEFNKKKSAEALNCGRASLYRGIDSLKAVGYITLDNKKIIINDLNGLERIVK